MADNYVLYKEYKEKEIVLITKGTKFNSYIYLENKIKDGNILTVLEYIKQQEKRERLGIKT